MSKKLGVTVLLQKVFVTNLYISNLTFYTYKQIQSKKSAPTPHWIWENEIQNSTIKYLVINWQYKVFIFIPESFNANISYKITFMNSQHKNTNSKGNFVLKNRF